MTQSNPSNFDDPQLQAAVRSLAGDHRASPALRDRVARAMAAVDVPTDSIKLAEHRRPSSATPTTPLRRALTAAAAVVVLIGGAFAGYDYYRSWKERHPSATAYTIAANVVQAMIATHDRGASTGSGDITSPALTALNDPKALAATASQALGRPVPTPAVPGWTLDRGSLCKVGDYEGVRFHFTRDGKGATLISLPESAWSDRMSDHYCTSSDGYPIAGYVAGPTLNCVIGDPSLAQSDVEAVLDSLRAQ